MVIAIKSMIFSLLSSYTDVLFTGTADGRVVKLENGEIETIARFGSGPCSKLKLHLGSSRFHPWRSADYLADRTCCGAASAFLLPGHLALECPVGQWSCTSWCHIPSASHSGCLPGASAANGCGCGCCFI